MDNDAFVRAESFPRLTIPLVDHFLLFNIMLDGRQAEEFVQLLSGTYEAGLLAGMIERHYALKTKPGEEALFTIRRSKKGDKHPHLHICPRQNLDPTQTWGAKIFLERPYILFGTDQTFLVVVADVPACKFQDTLEEDGGTLSFQLEYSEEQPDTILICWKFFCTVNGQNLKLEIVLELKPIPLQPNLFGVSLKVRGNVSRQNWPRRIVAFLTDLLGVIPNIPELCVTEEREHHVTTVTPSNRLKIWLKFYRELIHFLNLHRPSILFAAVSMVEFFKKGRIDTAYVVQR